jgi:hypothetical protein
MRETTGALCLLASVVAFGCSRGSSQADAIADARANRQEALTDVVPELPLPADLVDSGETEMSACPPELRIVAPPAVVPGEALPVLARVTACGETARQLSGTLDLTLSTGTLSPSTVKLVRGAGGSSAVIETQASGELLLSADGEGLHADRPVTLLAAPPSVELSGELQGEQLGWSADREVHVTDELIVPAGAHLVIEPGTRVKLGPKANVLALGSISCLGTEEAPVWWGPLSAGQAWGGVLHDGSTGTYEWTFFQGGGGDSSKAFGHSGSQPVLFVKEGSLQLKNSILLDNPGKALGAQLAKLVRLEHCLITRCDTGGELKESLAFFLDTHVLDIPSDDGIAADDDNDGLYLAGAYKDESGNSPASLLERCVFAVGKDDGLDQNGAIVKVEDCSFEGFAHEGVACSGGGTVVVSNSLVRQCEQGIEAGYGDPEVAVEHSVVTGNAVGFRYGDSYDWEVTGTLTVANSISAYNSEANVKNHVNRIDGPAEGALDISYSMVDDPAWDEQQHNLPGKPLFDASYRLAPGSPGHGAAADGADIGLLPE